MVSCHIFAMAQHRFWHCRGYLPHFDAGGTTQSITFRLADSLPPSLRVGLATLDDGERRKQIEKLIDSGYGSCLLRKPACAAAVRDSLTHFDGVRYRLIAWVVMPNHVHALIEQIFGWRLAAIVQAWKSVSARKIATIACTSGRVWAPDYFDRFIRDAAHYANALAYIEENPAKAKLVRDAHDWPFSSLGARTPSSAIDVEEY
jgi:REP element-mobilizing transposase RayT